MFELLIDLAARLVNRLPRIDRRADVIPEHVQIRITGIQPERLLRPLAALPARRRTLLCCHAPSVAPALAPIPIRLRIEHATRPTLRPRHVLQVARPAHRSRSRQQILEQVRDVAFEPRRLAPRKRTESANGVVAIGGSELRESLSGLVAEIQD